MWSAASAKKTPMPVFQELLESVTDEKEKEQERQLRLRFEEMTVGEKHVAIGGM